MKKYIIGFLLVASFLVTSTASAATRVHSYVTKRGTHVSSYMRSDRDYTKTNNYSYHGNINPYTGKRGYKW